MLIILSSLWLGRWEAVLETSCFRSHGLFWSWLFRTRLSGKLILWCICVPHDWLSLKVWFAWFYQYYAKGDSWRLPDGAYETMLLLKDAGGWFTRYSASFFAYCQQYCCCFVLVSYCTLHCMEIQLSLLLCRILTPAWGSCLRSWMCCICEKLCIVPCFFC